MDCAKFFQFNSFQRGNIIEVGQTVFCWLKPAPLALWRSKAQVHRSHVLSLAALWHHSLLMNGIVMYMYYLLEKKNEICVRRQNGRTNSYYRNDPKFSDRQVWANSADPDQTADQHLDCLPFRLHLVMRKPVYAMCEQKRHRSASLYAFHSQSNSPLLYVYMSYTSLDCKNAPIFSTV